MKKFTLNVDEAVIELAKRIARERGTSVSSLFSHWIRLLTNQTTEKIELPPNSLTVKATGVARLAKGESECDVLVDSLMEKYTVDRS